ncbi:MAG: hypothetical protein QXU69_04490 [Thermofilaceae archaeon]
MLERAREALEEALRARDRRKVVEKLISRLLGSLSPEGLRRAIEEGLDVVSLIYNHYGLASPALLPLFRAVMRMYWREFEEVATDVEKVYRILSKRPELREVLESEEAKRYLNKQVENLYRTTYRLVWGD